LRKRERLEQLWRGEKQIEGSLPQPPTASGRAPALSEELQAQLVKFSEQRRGKSGGYYNEACALVERLLQDFGAGGSPPTGNGVRSDDDDDLWGALSLEHELHGLANDLYREGHLDAAIELYELVLRIDPYLLESWFNEALALIRKGRYEQAHQCLSRAAELNPNLADIHYTRGLCFEYELRYQKAIAQYDKALEVDPTCSKAHSQREIALAKLAKESAPSGRGGENDDGHVLDFAPYLIRPENTLADVGGHHKVKRLLRVVVACLKGSPALTDWGIETPRGVLLCGPPGVGKTHLARCLAGEAGVPFYCPPSSIFANMWAGSEEKSLRRLFEQASEHCAAVVFLDEFDALASRRVSSKDPHSWYNRIVACLLELMDNAAKRAGNIVVMACTNTPRNIDRAFLRPGRFNYVIKVAKPNAHELLEIWLAILDMASRRAKREDFLVPEFEEALDADRSAWVEEAIRADKAERSGLLCLARLCAAQRLTGDAVREVVRRAITEKAMAELEGIGDMGPLSRKDLMEHLQAYIARKRQ
jgi:tetratricopeptide (TPR) repeat protein